jgi:hypothetical protein
VKLTILNVLGGGFRERCTSDQFQCGENGNCIPARWKCDYHKDCEHGQDEYDCRKPLLISKNILILDIEITLGKNLWKVPSIKLFLRGCRLIKNQDLYSKYDLFNSFWETLFPIFMTFGKSKSFG